MGVEVAAEVMEMTVMLQEVMVEEVAMVQRVVRMVVGQEGGSLHGLDCFLARPMMTQSCLNRRPAPAAWLQNGAMFLCSESSQSRNVHFCIARSTKQAHEHNSSSGLGCASALISSSQPVRSGAALCDAAARWHVLEVFLLYSALMA